MNLTVIGSGSKGNMYIMTANNGDNIIIEGGVTFSKISKAMDFDFSKTQFALCTHEHLDHSKGIRELKNAGIDVVMSKGTSQAAHIEGLEFRDIILKHGEKFKRGDFEVMAFNVNHDCAEPFGFLIYHPEAGLTLFLTDTYYVGFKFPGCNNLIIEANFCEKIMAERFDQGRLQGFLRDRICKSHLSLNNCLDVLRANDLTSVNNILLIHLSSANSDAVRFQSEVYNLTLKNVNVAEPGLKLRWDKTPFG